MADLAASSPPVRSVVQTSDTFDDSLYEPVTFTFRYLIALNLFAGLVMAAGLLLAGAATAATRSELDLAPGSPPGPLIAVPGGVLATILAVVAGVALASGAFAQFRAARAKPGEVLRGA